MSDPKDAPVRYSDDANLEPDEREAVEVPAAKGTELEPAKGTELPEGTELDVVLWVGPCTIHYKTSTGHQIALSTTATVRRKRL